MDHIRSSRPGVIPGPKDHSHTTLVKYRASRIILLPCLVKIPGLQDPLAAFWGIGNTSRPSWEFPGIAPLFSWTHSKTQGPLPSPPWNPPRLPGEKPGLKDLFIASSCARPLLYHPVPEVCEYAFKRRYFSISAVLSFTENSSLLQCLVGDRFGPVGR